MARTFPDALTDSAHQNAAVRQRFLLRLLPLARPHAVARRTKRPRACDGRLPRAAA